MCTNATSATEFNPKLVLQELKPVLDDSILADTPVTEVTVCRVRDKKQISRLVLELNEKLPLPGLHHLKRVCKDEIILHESSSEDNCNLLIEHNVDVTGLDLKSRRKIKVAATHPKTRKQYLRAQSAWSCAFTEDRYLQSLISNTLFTDIELGEHCKWMMEAISAAKRSLIPVGAVVVDPETKNVLAVASDDRSRHPLKHAVMVVVDLVARTQGGGLWPVKEGDFVFTENSQKLSVTHSKRNTEGVEKPMGPYLCTGYDLYVTREPCTVCAMALVHSRVRRVFYGCENRSGALGTLVKIHTLKGLNHHYEVFKGLLLQECWKLYTKLV